MSKLDDIKDAFIWGKEHGLYNIDFPDIDWLIETVDHLHKQNNELRSEIIVLNSMKREGN